MKFRYETHCHTYPVSRCAVATVKETLEYYKSLNYAGIFITNHFIDGNVRIDSPMTYQEKINYYCSDYENALKLSKEIGIKVFFGVELSYHGTDFLVYGLDKQWYLNHPEIENMNKKDELKLMRESGALVIHAHPFREACYIDHIRLFPSSIDGVEVINANRTDFENMQANQYADNFNFLKSAGSDNHSASKQRHLAGVEFDSPILDESDFVIKVKEGKSRIFVEDF